MSSGRQSILLKVTNITPMNHHAANIALIYFSRRADAESRQKAWFRNKARKQNKAIASSLIVQSSRIVKASGLPVFHYHEGNQQGRTFGEKIANAYAEVFGQGYDAVIAVGNDSPELGQIDWQDAISRLQAGECVLGASMRGGAYFIGIHKAVFDAKSFSSLPWQTHRLFKALKTFCAAKQHAPYLLQVLRDVNSIHDLVAITKSQLLGRKFKRLLTSIISWFGNFSFPPAVHLYFSLQFSARPLRAPPFA